MCTHEHQHHHQVSGPAHKGHGRLPVRKSAGRTARTQMSRGGTTTARVLLGGALLLLVSSCSQQPSQDMLKQMNARLEQLEQKITQLDAKDAELTELVNDGKATTIKLEENVAALVQQVEKIVARPSALATRKSSPPSGMVSPGEKHHTVSRGETLYSIAKRYGLSVDELRRINNLNQGQQIQTGQKLLVAQ